MPDYDAADSGIVLIAENDEMIADLIALIVKNVGYVPLVAHNGRRAVELVRERRPALLIADPMLPDLAGPGLLTALRIERAAGLRTILITSSPRTQAGLVDADAILPMPFHVAALAALLERLLPIQPHTRHGLLRNQAMAPYELSRSIEEFSDDRCEIVDWVLGHE